MKKSLREEREELQAEITKLRATLGSKAATVPASKISESKMSWLQINRTLEKELSALQSLQRQVEANKPKPPPPVMTRKQAETELTRLTAAGKHVEARKFYLANKKLLVE